MSDDVKDDDHRTQNQYWPLGKWVCTTCEQKRPWKSFRQIGQHGDPERRYSTQCLICDSKEEQERFKQQVEQRKKEREHKKQLNKEFGERVKARHKKNREKKRLHNKIEKELAERELARRSLLAYTERHVPGYEAGWVHEDICFRLEKFMKDVENKKSPRLMLWMPPRHGKSEIASTQFPGWVLGHHPEWEFISSSYSVDLPLGFSRKIRARIKSEEHRALFPDLHLAKDSQSAESWKTTRGGGYRAAGVGGGITGMGAHIFVVDDPVKDAEEADSETRRETVKGWFGSTAYTRLAPGGGMLVIQTRWHDDDLSGWLERQMNEALRELEEMRYEAKEAMRLARFPEEREAAQRMLDDAVEFSKSIDRWEIIKYPAIATTDEYIDLRTGSIVTPETRPSGNFSMTRKLRKKGDPLHPARFNATLLSKYKRTLQPRHWSALYQQNPVPDEGLYFTKDMLTFRPEVPDIRDMNVYIAWDLAIGQKNTNDWTVGVVLAHDWEDNVWLVDVIRGKWQTHDICKNILDAAKDYNAVLTGIEKGQLELAIRPELEKQMHERGQFIALAEGDEALKPITDKVVRARPLQGRMQQHKVFFPSDKMWIDTVVQELLRFPGGLHDDIVDGLAWGVRMIMAKQPPGKPNQAMRGNQGYNDGHKSWRDRLADIVRSQQGPKNFMGR